MNGDLSTIDDRELARLAYSRADTPEQMAKAASAAKELSRRAAPGSVLAEGLPLQQTLEAQAEEEHGFAPASNSRGGHRRGAILLLAVLGVALILVAASVAGRIAAPGDLDPLAVFDQPESELDAVWASRLAVGNDRIVTQGPRVVDLGQDMYGMAFRESTNSNSRPTAFDWYCIALFESPERSGGWGGNTTCVTPEEFDASGVSVEWVPLTAEGLPGATVSDAMVWGPTGSPRFEPSFGAAQE